MYCTAILIGKDGTLLSKHRKVNSTITSFIVHNTNPKIQLVPTGVERLVWGRGSGEGIKVVDAGFGKVGGLICWENYMPAARLALYQLGIE